MSSCPDKYAGCYVVGDTMYFPLTFAESIDSEGSPVDPIDLTGASAKMELRENVTDAGVAQLMSGGILDPLLGTMEFTLTEAQLYSLVPRTEALKSFSYSVKLTYSDLTTETILSGVHAFEQVATE